MCRGQHVASKHLIRSQLSHRAGQDRKVSLFILKEVGESFHRMLAASLAILKVLALVHHWSRRGSSCIAHLGSIFDL